MASQETAILKRVWKRASERGMRLWRNNIGLFLSLNGTPTRCGLCDGSADLIGITPTTITPEMVGKTIAVFTSIEVKTATGRASESQLRWQERIRELGGIALIVRHEDEL